MALIPRLLARLYRPVVRRAARATFEGRRVDPTREDAGRFLRSDIDAFLDRTWLRVTDLLREEDLQRIPTWGNRHNVFLGALTVAAYQVLLDLGVERRYAMELFADVGWKVYERLLRLPLFLARLRTRDPQRRMDIVLEALMRFPFSAPGRPGYEVRAWSEPGRFLTHWSYCAPLGFVERLGGRRIRRLVRPAEPGQGGARHGGLHVRARGRGRDHVHLLGHRQGEDRAGSAARLEASAGGAS